MLTKLSIDDRTQKSTTIFDGVVIAQQSCWNTDKSLIYTVNTISVKNILKGSSASTVEIITPGGELNGRLLVVEPNADLEVGSTGVFFLTNNKTALNYTTNKMQFEIYGLAQGFVKLDEQAGIYTDAFEVYDTRTALYHLIQKTTGIAYREANPSTGSNHKTDGNASISIFTPSIITAGTQSTLTINGLGFGKLKGTVRFRDANNTIPSAFINLPDSTYIVSWKDTEIKVLVPGSSANRQAGAGSGAFYVITADGLEITSNSPVTISYNQFEYKKNNIALINQNGLGGYTFTLNDNFSSNTNVKSSFLRALTQWQCKTGVNISINPTTTSNTCNNMSDNENTISFASTACPLPSGALGVTYSSYTLCAGSPVIPDGIDMIFSPNANFYFGADNNIPFNQYDFESVALHELGHALGQGHNLNNAEIMYPSIANGVSRRVLNATSDLLSVNDVVTRSTTTAYCGYGKHKSVTTPCNPIALQTTPIVAQFSTDKIKGCAPLTVTFTDQSTGGATNWKWDVDNNGTTDYTTQNPTHTFTTAGIYTVKLIAYNTTTKDSIIKTAVISVAPTLKLSVGIEQNISCNGGANGALKAVPTGGNGAYTYNWGNNKVDAIIGNITAGNYTVTVKDGFNCIATSTKTITEPEKIKIAVSTLNNNATIDVTGGIAPYIYLLNDITTLANNIINGLTSGSYTVYVKDNNNCIQNASFSVATTTGVKDAENKFDKLEVYPNPANNFININFSLKDNKSVKLELLDLSGQIVFEDEYSNIRDKQTAIDLTGMAAGMYMLKLGLPEGDTFRKILVSK